MVKSFENDPIHGAVELLRTNGLIETETLLWLG
jgi:hypothetical protein